MLRFLIILLLFTSCNCRGNNKRRHAAEPARPPAFRFDTHSPATVYRLPEKLNEISGISPVSESLIACIADEKGIVYFYDMRLREIVHEIRFTDKGDFEDLVVTGDVIYVLNSNGEIWTIAQYMDAKRTVSSSRLQIEQPFELEGLCAKDTYLLTAAKFYHNKKRNSRTLLPVWPVSLPSMQVAAPLFLIPDNVGDISKPNLPFHTSAICFDSTANEFLLLSTFTKLLLRCSTSGEIIQRIVLPENLFTQPEGLCITAGGQLLISNEGKEGKATVIVFNPKKNQQ